MHTSSVAAIGPAPAGGAADERQRARGGRSASRTSTPSTRPRSRRCGSRRAGCRWWSSARPTCSARATRIAPRPSSCAASCCGASPPTSTARSMSSTSPTSPPATCSPTSAASVGERYILGNRNYTWERLFADLSRLSGVEAPAVRLRVALRSRSPRRSAGCPGRRRSRRSRSAARRTGGPIARRRRARELGWTHAPARGDRGGDRRVVSRARGERLAALRQPPGARLAGRRAAPRAGWGRSSPDREAAPLPDADELAVPVRPRRSRAAAEGDRGRDGAGGPAVARPRRGRRPHRPAPCARARARPRGDLRLKRIVEHLRWRDATARTR